MKALCSYCKEIKRIKRLSYISICTDCFKTLPLFIKKKIKSYTSDDILSLLDYQAKSIDISFSPTAHYEKMLVDEKNGVLAIAESSSIAKSVMKGKKPLRHYLSKGEIFLVSLFDLNDIGLYCVKPRGQGGEVVCDVELYIKIDKLYIDEKLTVKSSAKCLSRKIDRFKRDWDEPGTLSMFRNILKAIYEERGKILSDSYIRMRDEMVRDETRVGMEFFGLSEGFTARELKLRRNFLAKAFHPDLGGSDEDTELRELYTKKLNELYTELLPYAKEK